MLVLPSSRVRIESKGSTQLLAVLAGNPKLFDVGRRVMPNRFRQNWYRKIADVIRSRRYTWLGQGLGGAPIDEAMVSLTTDVMHICKRQGIDVGWLLEQSKAKFEQEERAIASGEATRGAAA